MTVADPGDLPPPASWGNAVRIAVGLSEPLSSPMIAERGYHIQPPGAAWPSDIPPITIPPREQCPRFVDRTASGSKALKRMLIRHPVLQGQQ